MFRHPLVYPACAMIAMAVVTSGAAQGAEGRARHKSGSDRAKNEQAAEGKKASAVPISRELAMRPLPAYRIGPPDVLQIEVTVFHGTQVGRTPGAAGTSIAPLVSTLSLSNSPPKAVSNPLSIGGVTASGGSVTITGTTVRSNSAVAIDSGKAKLADKNAARQPTSPVGPLLSGSADFRITASQPNKGQYVVAPDGTVNLREYGMVQVMGKTVDEVKAAVEKQVSKCLASPKVSVDVIAYNSKTYYIITAGAGLGDNVRRMPITGGDTVLDALAAINGLSQVSSTRMWIARPSAKNAENGTVLPIDYEAITQRGATATNYQLMPGDRLFIAEDTTSAVNTWVAKKTTSVERVMGLISLGAATIESVEKIWGQDQKREKDEQ
jgi:polysaccharide biosynthesis/export protein